MSLKQCQREVDSAEFSEWWARHLIEPIGQERDDLNAALIRKTLIDLKLGRKAKNIKLKNLLVDFWADHKAQTPQDHRIVFDAFFHALRQCCKPAPQKIVERR